MQFIQKIGIFSGICLAFLVSGNLAKAANLSFTAPQNLAKLYQD
jgi:hypothetical protein